MKRNLISFFMGVAFMLMFALIGCTTKPGSTVPTFNAATAFSDLALAAQVVANNPLPPGVTGAAAVEVQDWAKFIGALAPQAAVVAKTIQDAQAAPATTVVVPTPAVVTPAP